MERYEKLLDLVGETQGQSVTARVVAEENGPFAASRIANAGAANGVREGFAAINEYGLVGRVVRVGEYTSRILMLTDFASRIPVMGTQSGDRALLVGDNGTSARLLEPETPDKIIPGEVWVTSGDDGKMPLGVRVGVARKDGEEWVLDLALQARPIDFVRLVPPPDFADPDLVPPLGGVQRNTDSTLRTVSVTPIAPVPSPAPGGAAVPPPARPAGGAAAGQGGTQ
jgi:rod shape-determining protein MreC